MATINPLELKKVKDLLDAMDPITRAYAEAMNPLLWDKVEQSIDGLLDQLGGMSAGDESIFDELVALLKASNDASDAVHVQTEEIKAKVRRYLRSMIVLFVTAQLGE